MTGKTKETNETKANEQGEKTYKTLSDIMDAPAAEGMKVLAIAAPSLASIAKKTGILKLAFSNTVVIASSPSTMAKLNEQQRDKINAEMIEIGENLIVKLLDSMGECIDEYKAILAAINGITVKQLTRDYKTHELVAMIKHLINDADFLTHLRTLTS